MIDPTARYIWSSEDSSGRNRYVFFRRTFTLTSDTPAGTLQLFADTRYRVLVNGVVLGHGPARFYVTHPEFDTYDLTPFLQPGENVIAVLVNSYGKSTYHSIASMGGLIAWGEVTDGETTLMLATGAEWRAQDAAAYYANVPPLSFALNPGEVLDTRLLPENWAQPDFDDRDWLPAVAVAEQGHWGELTARRIPLLDEREVWAHQRLGVWRAEFADDEDRYSFLLVAPHAPTFQPQARACAFTYLFSPCAQTITFGAYWGRYWVNGEEIPPILRTDVPLRQDFTVALREGWNSLLVLETMSFDVWELYFGFPRAAGIQLSAEAELGSPHTFLLAGPWLGEQAHLAEGLAEVLTSPGALPAALGAWTPWLRGQTACSPYFERGWRRLTRLDDAKTIAAFGADYAISSTDTALVLLYDFGSEVLGRPVLTFSSAAGTKIDLHYTERVVDGTADHYYNCVSRLADRCITRGGQQRWQPLHPRGFRYLEVVVHGDIHAFSLRHVGVTRANYPVRQTGSFACSDPHLTRIWQLGADTQFACMEDVFLDCPARERGLYAEDFFIQGYTTRAVFGDTDLYRQCIRLFFLSQGENGTLAGLAPNVGGGTSVDFMIYPVLALWNYYAWTGDMTLLREMAPALEKLLNGLHALGDTQTGLVDWLGSYIDICAMDRSGVNCAVNCFVQRAFAIGAQVLTVLGDAPAAAHRQEQADRLAAVIRRDFWDTERKVFTDRRRIDCEKTEPSVPANTLPLYFGFATEEQTAGALEYLLGVLQHNELVAHPERGDQLNVNASFVFFPLHLLFEHGYAREAEAFIRTSWGRMLDNGATTCWEYFTDNASRCHAWSSAPTYFLHAYVLGITFPDTGNPDRVSLAPHLGTLSWAEGVYPHPRGPIHIAWQLHGDHLQLSYDVPDGVEVMLAYAPDYCMIFP